MVRNTYSARTTADLQSLSNEHRGLSVFSDLSSAERECSASKWSLRHLIAYRLLIEPESSFLATFALDHRNACPVCHPDKQSPQKVDQDSVSILLQHVGPLDLLATERDLLQRQGGPFWVSLAQACHPDCTDEPRKYPERERQPTTSSDFVDSSAAIQGSSSPTHPSSSDYDMSTQEVDEDENEERRRVPEDVSVRLLIELTRYVLQLCLVQPDDSAEVRARIQRKRATARIGDVDVTCVDDGGVGNFERLSHGGWEAVHPYLALFEGKKAFRHLRIDPQTCRSSPIVSDDTLAQYLAEALLTWRAHRMLLKQDVFLIAISNTFVRFIHFCFSADYGEYLDADAIHQKRLINDSTKDTCARMRCTKWFNLQSSEGRKMALCHILALLRWHVARGAIRAESKRILEPDGDYSMYSDSDASSD